MKYLLAFLWLILPALAIFKIIVFDLSFWCINASYFTYQFVISIMMGLVGIYFFVKAIKNAKK